MSAPAAPLDPTSTEGRQVAARLTQTLAQIEWEITNRTPAGTSPQPSRPKPTPPPQRQAQAA
ncbi:hypothetical protein [Micromonospora sp. KC213]|uniref:hypothetical protein n=1 Tax=Micromonospora sp. KC213 TaxID=2530378 RepID=UPI00104516AE|nr:hypothetical protein [Micromonospora sp. KC213]TDC33111.1 hypothetical protein E1166_26020 [Micromonospora sp. KC213]